MMIEAPNLWTATALGVCLSLGLGACTTPAIKVDANSPVAAHVVAAADDPGPYPRFSQIPEAPNDVRSPAAWGREVAVLAGAGAKLALETAPATFSLADTEAFAEQTRGALAGAGAVPDADAGRAQADAFVRSARERATPPPSTR